jgi:hypothetical protein
MAAHKVTRKLAEGLRAAVGLVPDSVAKHMTHDELYRVLERNGYTWDGVAWSNARRIANNSPGPVAIRFEGLPEHVQKAGDDVTAALIARGYVIKSTSRQYPNVGEFTVRVYVHAELPE